MIIYSVRADVNSYQSFLPTDRNVSVSGRLIFDCQPQLPGWAPPEVYIQHPKLKRGNFFGFSGKPTCDEATRDHDELAELLELSGELLPLPHEGETFYILNVLECINALDRDKSVWHPAMRGTKVGSPTKYVFHRSRIPETPLFMIPETSRGGEVLCAENAYDKHYEFKHMYEHLGLTGLFFTKLWSDED